MAKMYNFIGTSVDKTGVCVVRGSADAKRIDAMQKGGQTNIVLIELPVPMCKLHGAKFMQPLPEFQAPEQQAAIEKYISLNDDGTMIEIEYETPVDAGSTDLEVA
jgi:hypothetical protein